MQCERVYEHMKSIGAITPMDAIRDYGIMRLSAVIFDLKRSGVPIRTRTVTGKNRFGEHTHYAEYSLGEKDA